MKGTQERIAVALCTDDGFAMNAAIVLFSLADHIPSHIAIDAYVLSPGISKKNLRRFGRALGGQDINIHHKIYDPAILVNLPISSWVSPVSHARMLLREHVDEAHDQVVYLDSDMLIVGDVLPLWDIPFDGATVKVCQDSKFKRFVDTRSASVFAEMCIDLNEKYFN